MFRMAHNQSQQNTFSGAPEFVDLNFSGAPEFVELTFNGGPEFVALTFRAWSERKWRISRNECFVTSG